MTTKFIIDKFREGDRKQLELIKKIINEKPSQVSQNALFLRKFTLAILKQYNKKIKVEEIKNNLSEAPEKINLEFKVPQAPSPVEIGFNLEAPKKFEL